MKIKVITSMLVMFLLITNIPSPEIKAQSSVPTLPNDLLFVPTITGEGGYFARNTIMRVDAATLAVSPFYIDDDAWELLPLSWSSQGDLLVIYRIMVGDKAYSYSSSPRQLCILDRSGELQRCFDDAPPMHYAGRPVDWQSYYPVVWGSNGQTIYFETEYPNAESPYGYGRRLVEASVLTGETLRVIYDYPDPYQVTMSPDLNHISVGFGEEWGGGSNPAYVFNLTTGTRLDVPYFVPANTVLSWGCQPFSPHGSYFTAKAWYDPARYAPSQSLPYDDGYLLLILDTQGTIQGTIGQPEGPDTLRYQDCPAWQSDEQAVFFYADNYEHQALMRYTLANQQITTLYELGWNAGHEPYVYSPLIPSPDGAYVALTVSDEPGGDRLVAVLYPDGEIYRIPSPYRFGLYPLWVPPLSEPVPTPTPTPTPTATHTPTATPTLTPTPTITPTATPVSNLPFNDGFESGLGNWTATSWMRISTDRHSGSWSVMTFRTADTVRLVLNTPLILTGTATPKLDYWTKLGFGGQGCTSSGYVEISTDDGASWITVQQIATVSSASWLHKQVDLSAYSGQTIRLRFRVGNPLGECTWRLDDIAVTAQ